MARIAFGEEASRPIGRLLLILEEHACARRGAAGDRGSDAVTIDQRSLRVDTPDCNTVAVVCTRPALLTDQAAVEGHVIEIGVPETGRFGIADADVRSADASLTVETCVAGAGVARDGGVGVGAAREAGASLIAEAVEAGAGVANDEGIGVAAPFEAESALVAKAYVAEAVAAHEPTVRGGAALKGTCIVVLIAAAP
jgi:hypothetical protein